MFKRKLETNESPNKKARLDLNTSFKCYNPVSQQDFITFVATSSQTYYTKEDVLRMLYNFQELKFNNNNKNDECYYIN